jgi:hypothetical protein
VARFPVNNSNKQQEVKLPTVITFYSVARINLSERKIRQKSYDTNNYYIVFVTYHESHIIFIHIYQMPSR